MNILIYPGTFDPIHGGHVDALKAAMREKRYDRIYILLQTNRFKEGTMFTYDTRLKFIHAAIIENNLLGVDIMTTTSPYFFDALDSNGIIQGAFCGNDSVDILIGDDGISSVEKWVSFNILKKWCRFVIIQRMMDVECICSTADRMFEKFYVISRINVETSCLTSTSIRSMMNDVLKTWRRSKTSLS
jgi:nicotinate-nucleotide adenylyltransferase